MRTYASAGSVDVSNLTLQVENPLNNITSLFNIERMYEILTTSTHPSVPHSIKQNVSLLLTIQ